MLLPVPVTRGPLGAKAGRAGELRGACSRCRRFAAGVMPRAVPGSGEALDPRELLLRARCVARTGMVGQREEPHKEPHELPCVTEQAEAVRGGWPGRPA